jgi:hypothetical protein
MAVWVAVEHVAAANAYRVSWLARIAHRACRRPC